MEGKTRFLAEDESFYRIVDVEAAQAALQGDTLDEGEATMIATLLSFEIEGADEVHWLEIAQRYEELDQLAEIVGKL